MVFKLACPSRAATFSSDTPLSTSRLPKVCRRTCGEASTHAHADFETSRHSGLLAAGGETLTIADFFELRLTRPQLAVLSACETAVPADLKSPDEITTLPTSLMVAGIPAVVGSLWSVADHSTAILMAKFYELWREEGLDSVQALHEAQRWMREEGYNCTYAVSTHPRRQSCNARFSKAGIVW